MNTIKILTLALISFLTFSSCSDDDVDTWVDVPNSEVTPVTKNNKVIYEVNVRNYSAEGNFKGLEKDLPHLKDLGVDILWLMPIHPIGEENREGFLGSPYAVKNYKAINPSYGTAEDFKSLINAAHAANMEIWIDWVANHTAWDNNWVSEHLDYYAEKDGQRPYSPEGWNDVVQLDYNNADMRAAMIDAMKYWVSEFNIDGYRCDAATFVPLSFWKEARAQVDAVKNITWLCEGDNADYMEAFDYDYAWAFNTAMNNFGKDNNVPVLVSECEKLFNNAAYKNKGRMVYLTNHDLNAHDGTEFTRYGSSVLPLTVLSFTIYDMPLIYNGQEIGMDKAMSLFDLDPVRWSPANQIYVNLFSKLTQLKRTQPALEDGANRGALKIYPTNNEKVFVYSRVKGDNEVLTVLNLGKVAVKFRFTDAVPSGQFKDYLNNTYKEFSAEEGIVLLENGYAVFVK
jgi:glycosidase